MQGMGRLWTERDHRAALEGQERAVTLNPSAPLARHFLACVLEFSSRPGGSHPAHRDAAAARSTLPLRLSGGG